MVVKSGRYELEIDKNDVILDNGSCIQIVTKKVGTGWNRSTPVISKANWKNYLKTEKFQLVETKDNENYQLKYYRLK